MRAILAFLATSLVVLAALVVLATPSWADEGGRERAKSRRDAPVDFSLESSAGTDRALSSYRGRVIVLFYEDRHHTETNAKTKDAVARYGESHGLGDRVAVVAVANLKGYDFAPASSIARKAIRAVARRVGIEILMDWRGVVIDALGAEDANSNVIVIDGRGVPRWHAAGRLGEGEQKALISTVEASLGDAPAL